jgi:hypothetical protein
MYCVKISINSKVTWVQEFATPEGRNSFLRHAGFVDGREVWYQPFTKEVAGLFERLPGQNFEELSSYRTCDQRIPKEECLWSILINLA